MTRYSNNAISNLDIANKVSISKIYTDGTDTYICIAEPGTALTAALWKIEKFDTDGSKTKCDGNDKFDNVATDAATVAALSYS